MCVCGRANHAVRGKTKRGKYKWKNRLYRKRARARERETERAHERNRDHAMRRDKACLLCLSLYLNLLSIFIDHAIKIGNIARLSRRQLRQKKGYGISRRREKNGADSRTVISAAAESETRNYRRGIYSVCLTKEVGNFVCSLFYAVTTKINCECHFVI